MPGKKAKATRKRPKAKLDDLPPDAVLSDEDLEQVRGAVGFTNYAAYWGSISLLKKTTQDPAHHPARPDGIVKEP